MKLDTLITSLFIFIRSRSTISSTTSLRRPSLLPSRPSSVEGRECLDLDREPGGRCTGPSPFPSTLESWSKGRLASKSRLSIDALSWPFERAISIYIEELVRWTKDVACHQTLTSGSETISPQLPTLALSLLVSMRNSG